MLPAASKEATTESINKFICTTADPIIAGVINFNTFLTPSNWKPILGKTKKSNLLREGSCTRYCSTPAIKTPKASALIGWSKKIVKNKADEINDIFRMTGVIAGKKNLPYVLKIPPQKAVNEIKNR